MTAARDGEILELALAQFGAFSRAQAGERGFSKRQITYKLGEGLWLRRAPEVFALPQFDRTFEQRAMVAHLHAGAGSYLSFECAGMLRDLDGITSAPIEVTVHRKRMRRIPAGKVAKVHYEPDIDPSDYSMVGPLPVASVGRIIADLARSRSLNALERMFECGHRRGDIDVDGLLAVAERLARRGKPGSARLRELAARVVADGKRNGSDAETIFFQILRDANLPLPSRQVMMLRDDGSHAYTDYAYEGVDAVLEVLGYAWHSSRASLDRDAERNNDINLSDKTLLEFTWTHLKHDRDYIVRTVSRLLGARRLALPARLDDTQRS